VLLDLVLPDANGFTLAAELARGEPAPKILLLTERQDEVTLEAAIRPPFHGLLPKACCVDGQLAQALHAVAQGRRYFPDEVVAAMREMERGGPDCLENFTPTERELLPWLGQGLTDDEIAGQRGGSPHTVRRHRQSVLAKLGLHSSMELARWALGKGFVVSGPGPGRPVELRDGTGSNGPWPR